jgi:hypothetical protein
MRKGRRRGALVGLGGKEMHEGQRRGGDAHAAAPFSDLAGRRLAHGQRGTRAPVTTSEREKGEQKVDKLAHPRMSRLCITKALYQRFRYGIRDGRA